MVKQVKGTAMRLAAAAMTIALIIGMAPAMAFAAPGDGGLAFGSGSLDDADLVSEDAALDAQAATTVSSVKVAFTSPKVGEKGDSQVVNAQAGATSARVAVPSGEGYKLQAWAFCTADMDDLASPVTFEAGKTYYLWVNLECESGYAFRQAGGGTSDAELAVTGANPAGAPEIYSYGEYSGMTALLSFEPAQATSTKAANPLATKAASRTLSFKTLKTKNLSFAPAIVKTKGQGATTYAAKSVTKKYKSYVSVAKKTGKVTVKRGAPKGKCVLVVNVKAAGTAKYAPTTKTAKVTITIR